MKANRLKKAHDATTAIVKRKEFKNAQNVNIQSSEKKNVNTAVLSAKRPGFIKDDCFQEASYYFENGLRKVYPYYYTFSSFTKSRWYGKSVIDIFRKEFRARPVEEYERCIENGLLQVNYEKVDLDYRLNHNDLITCTIHRHETPVLAQPIKIVHVDNDLVVVDKPCSIPVHPCGCFRSNSVMFILAKEYNLRNLYTTYRLDRLTSGLLIFAKSSEKAGLIHCQINSRKVQKVYICRVEGEFPTGEVVCNEPVDVFCKSIGVSRVYPEGKECKTAFQRLGYNGKSSVVCCKPVTGKMHQIRVHLQYLGYPIVNDPVYNHEVFGPEKGRGGFFGRSIKELEEDLIKMHCVNYWLGLVDESDVNERIVDNTQKGNETVAENKSYTDQNFSCRDRSQIINYHQSKISLQSVIPNRTGYSVPDAVCDKSKITIDPYCCECRIPFKEPVQKDLVMYLHAWKYTGPGWSFNTELPEWARPDWTEPE